MQQANASRAILGGFVATLALTLLLYLLPYAGGPKMDIAAALGSLFGHGIPAAMSGWWWAGIVWHALNGTFVFSLLYAYLVYGWLRGEDWLRGTVWGLVLWAAMEIVFMPLTRRGIFDDQALHPAAHVLASIILLAIYGAVLGAVAGEQAEHHLHVAHPA